MERAVGRSCSAWSGAFQPTTITLLSIVQGITLETLVSRVSGYDALFDLGVAAYADWAAIVLMLYTVFYVWVAVAWIVTVSRWTPTLTDSVIPLALGHRCVLRIDGLPASGFAARGGLGLAAI